MKIKKFQSKQLLKLHLLKSRVYESFIKKNNFNDLKNTNLDQILVGVKKALQIIFQYNQSNKRILFIGLPPKLEFKINSLTRHLAISNHFDASGIVSNNTKTASLLNIKNLTQNTIKQNLVFLLPKFTKKFDLVILFDHEKCDNLLFEAWVAKLPMVAFTSTTDFTNSVVQSFYLIDGNFKNMLTAFDQNIFFIGLNSLFKNLRKNFKRKR